MSEHKMFDKIKSIQYSFKAYSQVVFIPLTCCLLMNESVMDVISIK